MAISLLAQGTVTENTSAGTTISLPYPAGMTATSYMVLAASTTTSAQPTNPAGWTQVYRASGTGSTLSPSLLVSIKQATGAESGSLSVTTPNSVGIGQIIAFSGVDLTTPQDVTATTLDNTTGTSSSILPTLTTTRTGVCLVYGVALANTIANSTAPTSPSTFTETMDRVSGTRVATMGYLIWASSGATGSVTVNYSGSGKSNGVLLALRPAASVSSNLLMFA